jgi:hypothetical protein
MIHGLLMRFGVPFSIVVWVEKDHGVFARYQDSELFAFSRRSVVYLLTNQFALSSPSSCVMSR